MRPLKCFIASNRHGAYCVPASSRHRPAASTIMQGYVWEAETLAFLTDNCAGGDIIHAGTYFGDFLPALSEAVAPTGALVWAFEPCTENFRCAQITLILNDIHNVTLARAALGAGSGNALLCTGQPGRHAGGGSSVVTTRKRAGFTYEEVPVVAVDETVPGDRPVSILQLDVEKYEQQALAGALVTIRRWRPLLVLETLPADAGWFAENILALGYEDAGALDENRAFRAPIRDPRE
ncbi:MAG: FkbM family methyltransferase [Rhizomicrobium sp.]